MFAEGLSSSNTEANSPDVDVWLRNKPAPFPSMRPVTHETQGLRVLLVGVWGGHRVGFQSDLSAC